MSLYKKKFIKNTYFPYFNHIKKSYQVIMNYKCLQGFVVEKLWVVSGVIFDVESESGIRISLSRQDFEIFEVMCSKMGFFATFEVMYRAQEIILVFFSKFII